MRLERYSVKNYKSLRDIEFTPKEFSVVVGPNGAGKSNFVDSLDFLAEVHRHGLELAVARRGGFENIAFRRMRRAKGGITFSVTADLDAREGGIVHSRATVTPLLRVSHSFSFATERQAIDAEFKVSSESYSLSLELEGKWHHALTVERSPSHELRLRRNLQLTAKLPPEIASDQLLARYLDVPEIAIWSEKRRRINPTDLFISSIGRYSLGTNLFRGAIASIRVFQISPTKSREVGVPTPRPELAPTGENLPAVVDLLKKSWPAEWAEVLSAMRVVLPGLVDIEIGYTTSRRLGLFFHEEGVGRAWSTAEVSDGTIQTLALLVAIHDPRGSMLVLEEPENSVHPWISRNLVDAFRGASKRKQVVVTTHSPVVLNAVPPSTISVLWRHAGESRMAPLTQLDPTFLKLWESGDISTFDFLDSGDVREALPPSPASLMNDELER